MGKYLIYFIAVLLFASCSSTEVDVKGSLSGIVKDSKTLQPLAGCIVTKNPGMQSITTGESGSFDFGMMEMGQYSLYASLADYAEQTMEVTVEATKSTTVDILMQEAAAPHVKTMPVEIARITTAVVNADIVSDGGLDVATCGFSYGKTRDIDMTAFATQEGMSFSCELTGLQPNTTYYYRAFARNSKGEALGDLLSFTTKDRVLPEILLTEATDVKEETATLVANTSATGHPDDYAVSRSGFYWGNDKYDMDKVSVSLENGTLSMPLTGLTPGETYYFQAFLSNEKGEIRGDLTSFIAKHYTYEGVEYVDLGLPSGTKWAVKNLGATSENRIGNKYAWGETATKSTFTKENYKFWNNDTQKYVKYTTWGSVLELEDDAAYVALGGNWRMPTKEQAEELLSNCSAEFVDGIKLTGKNGNYIIIESAPWLENMFWTTKYETVLGYQYYGLCVSNMNNYIGGCIRPVFK